MLGAGLTEVTKVEVAVKKFAGGLRDQNLTAVPGAHQPRCAMDVEARVEVSRPDGCAGVNADADADRRIGPLVLKQRTLPGSCS
jgi:hypothetical protein